MVVQELIDILCQVPKDAEVFIDQCDSDCQDDWLASGNAHFSAQNSLLIVQKRAFISEEGQKTFVLRIE